MKIRQRKYESPNTLDRLVSGAVTAEAKPLFSLHTTANFPRASDSASREIHFKVQLFQLQRVRQVGVVCASQSHVYFEKYFYGFIFLWFYYYYYFFITLRTINRIYVCL